MFWENLRVEEFKDAIARSGGLCVLPIGCVEKHGQHLPVGTDAFIAESVVEEAAELADVVVFHLGPWLGEVSCFHSYDDPEAARVIGSIGIKQETLLRVLEEICDEIARNGFRKILLLNSHGGNVWMLDHFLRCQGYTNKGYSTMWAWAVDDDLTEPDRLLAEFEKRPEDFPMITPEDIAVLEGWTKTGYGGGHADFRETALVMADRPELVAPDRYEAMDGRCTNKGNYWYEAGLFPGCAWVMNCPNEYSGYPPHGCSPTIGQAMVKVASDILAKKFTLIQNDENCVAVARGTYKPE